jgi:hypothetical protein
MAISFPEASTVLVAAIVLVNVVALGLSRKLVVEAMVESTIAALS